MTNAIPNYKDSGDFDSMVRQMNESYRSSKGPIFETDASGLYEAYLASFTDPEARQYHTCSCCRKFIETYGHLAQVTDEGNVRSVLWSEWAQPVVPAHFEAGVRAMAKIVAKAKLVKPFLTERECYGDFKTYTKTGFQWNHFAVHPLPNQVFHKTGLLNAFQTAATKPEEYKSVMVALSEYPAAVVDNAVKLLTEGQFKNSDAAVGQAKFLQQLHGYRSSGGQRYKNLVFNAVADAPAGFCHPRSSVISTLLDDLVAGLSFEDASAKWNAKMHPLKYQRAQVKPTDGAIEAASKAFAALGAESALKRRYATFEDVQEWLWQPKQETKKESSGRGVFDALKTNKSTAPPQMVGRPIEISWEKFAAVHLHVADKIEYMAEHRKDMYTVLTAAVEPDSRPILQWDSADNRNTVASFNYLEGSSPREMGLESSTFVNVLGVTKGSHEWHNRGQEFSHHGKEIFIILDGAKDMNRASGQSAIFPNTLKSEFHPFRATVEFYSKENPLLDIGEAHVIGRSITDKMTTRNPAITLRVITGGQVTLYKIDRW